MLRAIPRTLDDSKLESFLLSDKAAFLYFLGDLEPPFSERTRFATIEWDEQILGVALVYQESSAAALLAYAPNESLGIILDTLKPPQEFAFHITPNLLDEMERQALVSSAESFKRYVRQGTPEAFNHPNCRKLQLKDLPAARKLKSGIDEIWFTTEQFSINPFVGVFDDDQMIAMAGTHCFSASRNVAALGSIGVHPSRRGEGWGECATRAILSEMRGVVDFIGLNVVEDNRVARRLYEKLGFKECDSWVMGMAEWDVLKS